MDKPIKDFTPASEPDLPTLGEDLKPKKDCPICQGKGFVPLAGGSLKVSCTCRYK